MEDKDEKIGLVVGHADPQVRAELTYQFRRLGWDAHAAANGPAVRRLATRWRPSVVVMATDLPGESGWLTAAKLCHERPEVEMVLIERDLAPEHPSFARFVGAALVVSEQKGINEVLRAVAQVAPAPTAA